MYSENFKRDVVMALKATASNLIARFAPGTYVKLTHQTGRGADENAQQVADYFLNCFEEYRQRIVEGGVTDFGAYLQGKRVLEYGPGDILGTALLFYAYGAERVDCVDRFPLQSISEKNAQVYRLLVGKLPDGVRERAEAAFKVPGDPASGLRGECVSYRISSNGLAGQAAAYDLVVSRAVLEHVNSLRDTLLDVEHSLRPGGLSLHSVDLRSHNLDRDRPLDFLTWPEWLYRLMYSHKGFPNRWRAGNYREILRDTRLRVVAMAPTARVAAPDLARIREHIAPHLARSNNDDLSWLGFWVTLEKPAAP